MANGSIAPDADRPPGPALEPLCVSAEQIATLRIIPTSVRAWRRADSSGKVPKGILWGGKKLWRMSDLKLFVAWGMPSREEFEKRLAAEGGQQ